MGAEILGEVTCPHCGNEHATVHHHQGRKSKLYYRCYSSRGGNEAWCGTVQITGPKGQEWIEKNLRVSQPEPYKGPVSEAANDPAPVPKGVEQPKKQESPPKGGVFNNFLKAFNEEE